MSPASGLRYPGRSIYLGLVLLALGLWGASLVAAVAGLALLALVLYASAVIAGFVLLAIVMAVPA